MRNLDDIQDVETPETMLGNADILGLPVALEELEVYFDKSAQRMLSYKEAMDPRVQPNRTQFFVPGFVDPLKGFAVDRAAETIEHNVDLGIDLVGITNKEFLLECHRLLRKAAGVASAPVYPSGNDYGERYGTFQVELNGVSWTIHVRTTKFDQAKGEIVVSGKVFPELEGDVLCVLGVPDLRNRDYQKVTLTTQVECRRLTSKELEVLKGKISIPAILKAIRDYVVAKKKEQSVAIAKGQKDTRTAVFRTAGFE